VRAVVAYARSFTVSPAATADPGNAVGLTGRRAATAAALTVADVIDWWGNNYDGTGVGLYGGTWFYTGDQETVFTLRGVRLNADLAVSGTVRWGRYSHQVQVRLTVVQVGSGGVPVPVPVVGGSISGGWDSRAAGAVATLTGSLDRVRLRVSLLAP
jgi:hypothetical protein